MTLTTRWTIRLASLLSSLLCCGAHLSADAIKTVDYVLQISIDGLRGDTLQRLVSDAPETLPNFYRLQTEGAFTYNGRADFANTETIPNHISMITGRPVSHAEGIPLTAPHGYTINDPPETHTIHENGNPDVEYKSSTFDVAHDNGLKTALFATKTKLSILDRSYDEDNGAQDVIGEDNGPDKLDVTYLIDGSSAATVNVALDLLETAPANYTFLHIVEPDTVGHFWGWTSPDYEQSITVVDSYLGLILEAIDTTPHLANDTAIVLTADHGGFNFNHGNLDFIENSIIPFFVWGLGLPGGVDLHDVATNRFDPGDSRPRYTAEQQPWRNGDAANVAMMALGLDPVPGSLMLSVFEAASVEGDFDRDGLLDIDDINLLVAASATGANDSSFDLNRDSTIDVSDVMRWTDLKNIWPGDANLDGEFNSRDFVAVFIAGEYEDGIAQNSVWSEGDWNGDGEFSTSDLVTAFNIGGYERGPRPPVAVPEPEMVVLPLLCCVVYRRVRRSC
ncbi:MAG: alkaline phosphatase family protein [Planctomycetales bacterium]|nr:alkaline phosphatase family protein [Planctomycetales bacterium]